MNNIKKYIYGAVAAMTVSASFTACTDYLDKAPESDISEDMAFKNFRNFQGFVEELYYLVPDFCKCYWNNSFNWGDDEIISTNVNYMMGYKVDNGDFWGWQSQYDGWQCGWMDINSFSPGSFSPSNSPSLWQSCWYGIRKCNIGLANLDLLLEATQEERNVIKGQLLFFRGWFHFELMQYFGGLPYIEEVLGSGKVNMPRLSYHECADKVAADLKEAVELLPINWDEKAVGAATKGNNEYRINKVMALSYLGKNYLWAASPLMNRESTGSSDYNKEYAKLAAEALGEVVTLSETGQMQYKLVEFKNYKDLFLTHNKGGLVPGSTEAIFRPLSWDWNRSNWNQTRTYGSKDLDPEKAVGFYPCANYVNFYGMANGLPLDDPDSGFDKSHPWKDRDPRFYHDIRHDGSKVELGGNKKADPFRYAPLYTGGNMRDEQNGSRTGYLNYKFVRDDFNQWDNQGAGNYSAQNHMLIPYMRLADIYLMYAESVAEATGLAAGKSSSCGLTAEDAINKLRDRAGVDHVSASYTGSLDKFMSEVRRERAVELAFEGHRFNDLRRWLLQDKDGYNKKTSIEFSRVGDLTGIESDSSVGVNTEDPNLSEVIGYHEEVILTRNFSEKHWWLPLKVNDTKMYVEFGQNPGW